MGFYVGTRFLGQGDFLGFVLALDFLGGVVFLVLVLAPKIRCQKRKKRKRIKGLIDLRHFGTCADFGRTIIGCSKSRE